MHACMHTYILTYLHTPTYTLPSHDIYGGLGKTIGKNRKSRIVGQPELYTIACLRACVLVCVRVSLGL